VSAALPQRREPATLPNTLSIGQVLGRLADDFPELSPSKLRFLEDRGLIHPARTASGYRSFSPADIERIKLVLLMQRDHYLPLKVIRGYLADLDAGRTPLIPGAKNAPGVPNMLSTGRRFKREELIREAGATQALLQDAVSASVIAPAEVYGEDQLAVLRALVELQRCGIEPRHLRGMRSAADREVGLVESALIARRGDTGSRAQTAELARDLAAQLEIVRANLIRAALARFTP
jgi:DNA-binding transcriptional MerR regulator